MAFLNVSFICEIFFINTARADEFYLTFMYDYLEIFFSKQSDLAMQFHSNKMNNHTHKIESECFCKHLSKILSL